MAHHDPSLAHLLVARIQDQIGEGLGQRALGERLEAGVEPLINRRDGRGREGVAAQFLGNRPDLPGGDALDIHLGQRGYEGLFRALIALEQLGREAAGSVLRHPQLEFADAGHQGAWIVAGAIAETFRRALALRRAQGIAHLGFEHLLQHHTHHLPPSIGVLQQKVFDGVARKLSFFLGHGGIPLQGIGDIGHHQLP